MAPKATYFTATEDALLIELKEVKNLGWKEIKAHFPDRTKGTLQVRYCRTLQHDRKERQAAFATANKPDTKKKHVATADSTPRMKAAYRVTKGVSPPANRDHLSRTVKNKVKFDDLLADADTDGSEEAGAVAKSSKLAEDLTMKDAAVADPIEDVRAVAKLSKPAEGLATKKLSDMSGDEVEAWKKQNDEHKRRSVSPSPDPTYGIRQSASPKLVSPKAAPRKSLSFKSASSKSASPKLAIKLSLSPKPSKVTKTAAVAKKATTPPALDAALLKLLTPSKEAIKADNLLHRPQGFGRALLNELASEANAPAGTMPKEKPSPRASPSKRPPQAAYVGNPGKFPSPPLPPLSPLLSRPPHPLTPPAPTGNWHPAAPLTAVHVRRPSLIPAFFADPPPFMILEHNIRSGSYRLRRRLECEYDIPVQRLVSVPPSPEVEPLTPVVAAAMGWKGEGEE